MSNSRKLCRQNTVKTTIVPTQQHLTMVSCLLPLILTLLYWWKCLHKPLNHPELGRTLGTWGHKGEVADFTSKSKQLDDPRLSTITIPLGIIALHSTCRYICPWSQHPACPCTLAQRCVVESGKHLCQSLAQSVGHQRSKKTHLFLHTSTPALIMFKVSIINRHITIRTYHSQ